MRYKTNVGMSYPASATVFAELIALAELPDEERQAQVARIAQAGGFIRAEEGVVVDNLPAASIPWLLAQGHIVAADDAPRVFKTPGAEKPVVPVAELEGE